MDTLDGFKLHDGDKCYVSVQDPAGEIRLSGNPRKAIYRSDRAREMGWDFEIPSLRCEREVEVCAVWMNDPLFRRVNKKPDR